MTPSTTPPSVARLPSHVIDHIAAGEVIERPASVVKELLENCLDAGATAVQVDIEGGGLQRITISDDGRGMNEADARLCYERHATSKLRVSEDLFAITTLGFRGEALSSIASVSRLTISTRQAGDTSGFRVVIHQGEVVEEGPMGCPVGTTMNVEDLFYNTPARKKFLRSPATEQAHIVEACLQVALSKPGTGLVLTSGKRRLLDIPGGTKEPLRVQSALGKRVEALYPFEKELDGIRVHGFVTRPELNRGDTKGLWFFINGRYVRDRMMQRAVLDGYRNLVGQGRYPIVVLSVEVNTSVVDVNVHPQKLEVRFSNGGAVFRAVSAAMASVLTEMPWTTRQVGGAIPTAGAAPDVRHAVERYYQGAQAPSRPPQDKRDYFAKAGWSGGATPHQAAPHQAAPHQAPPQPPSRPAAPMPASPVGAADGVLVKDRFWMQETPAGLRWVDLARVASHFGGESYRRGLKGGTIPREGLMFPEVLELDRDMSAFCEEHWESLSQFGFEIEPVGPGRFALRAIPLPFVGAEPTGLAALFLKVLREGGFKGQPTEELNAALVSACQGYSLLPKGASFQPEMVQTLLSWVAPTEDATPPTGMVREFSEDDLTQLFDAP